MTVDIVTTIVESMEKHPDKWIFVEQIKKLVWVRLEQPNTTKVVDVKIDGTIEVGTGKGKTIYGKILLGYWERRKLVKAVEKLFREKAVRIIDRALLNSPEKPA